MALEDVKLKFNPNSLNVSKIPKKRYKYYLTPSGFAEKSRLTFQHFQNFTNLYKVARRDFHEFFNKIQNSDIKEVVFCGVDEVTEIAFLSLKETDLKLTGVIDDQMGEKQFFGQAIRAIEEIGSMSYDIIVITSFQNGKMLKRRLLELGVDEKKIYDIGDGGWLKRIDG